MEKIVLTILLSASLLLYVSAVSNADASHPDIRGRITKIRPPSTEGERRLPGTVMVEAEDKTDKVDKANLIITDKTRILKQQEDKRVEATFDDLKVGQLVEAQFVEGPTIMIYPLQVEAAEIAILSAGEEND
jgi:hypothetical protein